MEKSKTTIESVLCRLEAKEIQAAADKFPGPHDALMEGMKMQLDIFNGQLARAKREIITLREFGLIITRIGLSALAAADDEASEEATHEE